MISSSLTNPSLHEVVAELSPVGLLMVQGLLELIRVMRFSLRRSSPMRTGMGRSSYH